MVQRVVAALGTGTASIRSSSNVTPDFSAASTNRRLAVRVSKGAFPQHSITSVPSPEQAAASLAVRNNALSSGASAKIIGSGALPNSARPGI